MEKMRMTTIWISPDIYQKLLQVERTLITKNGRNINPSDAVKELIEFWKKHQSDINYYKKGRKIAVSELMF
jgi:predicted CopG family antitoxin